MPRISRLRPELPTEPLPLAVGSQLGDLAILVDRDDRVRIDGRARRRGRRRIPRRRSARPCSEASKSRIEVVAVLPVDQRAGACAASFSSTPVSRFAIVVRRSGRRRPHPRARTAARCPAQTMRDVGAAAQRRAQHREHRREIDVRRDDDVTRALRPRAAPACRSSSSSGPSCPPPPRA